jgi:hypothetical protein
VCVCVCMNVWLYVCMGVYVCLCVCEWKELLLKGKAQYSQGTLIEALRLAYTTAIIALS